MQPGLKALAKHRRQRLRELQAEQDLKANLGTFTGEMAVPRAPACSALHLMNENVKADQ